MFFCPNCNNAYDISKDSLQIVNQSGGDLDYSKFIELTLSGISEDEISKNVKKINIYKFLKSKEYKKLTSKEKEIIYNKIQDVIPIEQKILIKNKSVDINESNMAYFICKNCLYNVPIKDGTKIYSKTSSEIKSNYTDNNMEVKLHSNILPITRKYICPNKSCDSNKYPERKEAVILRNNNSFSITYICKICKTYW